MLIKDYDRIVLISIDHRYPTDFPRVKQLIESKQGREIVPFINGAGTILPAELYNQVNLTGPPPHWSGSPGTYHHWRAFRHVLEDAKRDGVENLLILEDDVDFTPDFDRVVSDATEQMYEMGAALPRWDLLYYGANHTWHRTDELAPNVLGLNGSYCIHCLGVRRRMFDPILSLPCVGVMDLMLSQHIHHDYNCYAIWPSVAVQRPGTSYLSEGFQDYNHYFKCKGANH